MVSKEKLLKLINYLKYISHKYRYLLIIYLILKVIFIVFIVCYLPGHTKASSATTTTTSSSSSTSTTDDSSAPNTDDDGVGSYLQSVGNSSDSSSDSTTDDSSSSSSSSSSDSTTMQGIADILNQLSCTTGEIGTLLRSDFSNTCIPSSLFTLAVSYILDPIFYEPTMARLKINDSILFTDDPEPCSRASRADPNNPTLDFGMCNDALLIIARTVAVANAAVAIVGAVFTGQSPWDAIAAVWNIPETSYHVTYTGKQVGDSGTMFDVTPPFIFPWKVIQNNDKICMATISLGGWLAVGCKYIKEPCQTSIYNDFINPNAVNIPTNIPVCNSNTTTQEVKDIKLLNCAGTSECYQSAYGNSRAPVVITGPLIECVKTMISKLMIDSTVCTFSDINNLLVSSSRTTSTLYSFQQSMYSTVRLLLTLYVILFGIKLIATGDIPPKAELFNFIIKFIFVVYFSIGLNTSSDNGSVETFDGMLEWIFPILLNTMTELATWIINASSSTLCKFDDIVYPPGLEDLALWDSLDCRISYYLGLDVLQTLMVEQSTSNNDFALFDNFSFPIPPYIYLLIPAIISGNFTLIALSISYPVMVISVGAFIVNATVVCMISIVILCILGPIFVPMYLFTHTRKYFDNWVRLLISFVLQPMAAVIFMTTMFSIYDFGFYGQCQYNSIDAQLNSSDLASMANITLPDKVKLYDNRIARYYFINQNWGSYSSDDKTSCQNSLGYILNNPLSFIKGIVSSPGTFFNMVEVVYEQVKTLIISLLTACFALYLMYNFSGNLAEFTANITDGIPLSKMAINPRAIYDATQSRISSFGNKAAAAKKASTAKGETEDNERQNPQSNRNPRTTPEDIKKPANDQISYRKSSNQVGENKGE